jgi:protein RecA
MGAIEDMAKALLDAVGENASGETVTRFIDTGIPQLNEMLCGSKTGGLPQGRLLEMYGPSSSGKTAIATHLMVQAQKAGGVAGFADHERAFDIDMATNPAMGLNPTFPFWIYKRPRTWEESNTMMAKASQAIRASKAISPDAPVLWVLDSIAAAIPKSSAGKEMDELSMNDTTALARVTSTTLKTMAQHADDYNFTVLYLNQIRTKPGVMFGDPTTTPGGGAMEFYSTLRLALGRTKIFAKAMVAGKEVRGEFVGQTITMKTSKNKLTRPFQELKWDMLFDENGNGFFDVTGTLVDICASLGRLSKSGAFIEWTDGKKYNRKPLIAHINSSPTLQAELHAIASL